MVDPFLGKADQSRLGMEPNTKYRIDGVDDLGHKRHDIVGLSVSVGLNEVRVFGRDFGGSDALTL